MASYRYVVRGRVQGVGYRYFVLRQAEALGIAGYARNRPDGTVEVVAEGADDVLASFEDRLRQGPSFAAVENLDRAPISPRGDQGFHIR
jgi:acylphosphatase